jgi:polyhydroxybutyrate depolymerase
VRRALILSFVGVVACRASSSTESSLTTSTATTSSTSSAPTSQPMAIAPSASASIAAPSLPPISSAAAALVAARSYRFDIPASYDGHSALPLLVLFHGYGASAAEIAGMVDTITLSTNASMFIATPNGTRDGNGRRFWNATDACCNFGGVAVDDIAYLSALLDDVASKHAVDPKRIYLAGHSNGGFFAHRAACELSPRIAAIASIAGPTWKDASRCTPTEPVSVAQIQGDADTIIHFEGGHMKDDPSRPAYPSAHETIATWEAKDGCGALAKTDVVYDLDAQLPGTETSVEASTGCPKGIGVELWTVHGMGHNPRAGRAWGEALTTFFLAHPKP